VTEQGGPRDHRSPPARYDLPLVESRPVSPTAMTFRFSTEGTDFHYRSQQAVRLHLPGVDDPWGATRAFSLSSSPTEKGTIAVTCKISDTPFKQALSRLAPGDRAVVFGPLGHFLLDADRPAVFIAGGIGITPFRGMIRYAADSGIRQPTVLLYSARTPEELVFRSELESVARRHAGLKIEFSITRPNDSTAPWAGRTGRFDAERVRAGAVGLERPRFYVAGLPEMVESTVGFLLGTLGVPPEVVLYESFRGY
jgi:glycine betaine catabolism B